MERKNQVSNLELSKILRELGFKQESLFYYSKNVPQAVDKDYHLYFDGVPDGKSSCGLLSDDEIKEQCYSAFTVPELGEELKKVGGTKILKAYRECCGNNGYNVAEVMLNLLDVNFLAKMLIYLKENNLI